MKPDGADAGAGRAHGLDGVRGVAAVVVVVTHCLQIDPVLADAADGRAVEPDSWRALAIYSPLHLGWAGMEAVLIFFVVSGYVLAKSASRPNFSWRGYYPSRVVRLYLPVWASVALAVATAFVLPRQTWPGASWFVNAHEPPTVLSVFSNSILIFAGTDHLNVPLWSLVWEVWFSLLLPLYLLLAKWSRSSAWRLVVVLAVLLAAAGVGSYLNSNALRYLPVFAFGVLLHFHRTRLEKWGSALNPLVGRGLMVLAALGLVSYWLIQPVVGPENYASDAMRGVQLLSAVTIVALVAFVEDLDRLFSSRLLGWLGRISFSLYLTHATVLIGVVTALRGAQSLWVTSAIILPLALVVAQIFYFVIEKPSHRIAQAVNRRASRATVDSK